MNTLLLYPQFPDTFWSFKHAVKFVGRAACNPPLGLVTVAAMLPKDWNLKLIDLNLDPLKEDDLTWADMVMISAMDVQRNSTRELIKRCKKHGLRIIVGGPLFTGETDKFPEVDHFILNEAELTLPPFLHDLAKGDPKRVYETPEFADICQTPMPRWDLLKLMRYDSMNVQFSRGCPFNCDFCNVTALLGHRPRTKTATQLIAELDMLYNLGWRRNIFLVDDNFIGNKRILKDEILPALIQWRKGKSGCLFLTEASINMADDDDLLQMMGEAGFTSVFIGIETPDDSSLTECHKSQNQKRNLITEIRKIQHAGIQVMAGFIVGFDSDSTTIFQRQIDFIQKSGIVTAMVGILQAPYGTQLYKRLQSEGRLLDEMSGDNADGNTNIIPIMDIVTLKKGYRHIMTEIYGPKLFYERARTQLKEFKPRKAPVTIEIQEIFALFRAFWKIGIVSSGRREFWRFFFWALFKEPAKLPLAVTLSIYGYHFRKISAQNFRVPIEAPINNKETAIAHGKVSMASMANIHKA